MYEDFDAVNECLSMDEIQSIFSTRAFSSQKDAKSSLVSLISKIKVDSNEVENLEHPFLIKCFTLSMSTQLIAMSFVIHKTFLN